jgi:hypothetical protein
MVLPFRAVSAIEAGKKGYAPGQAAADPSGAGHSTPEGTHGSNQGFILLVHFILAHGQNGLASMKPFRKKFFRFLTHLLRGHPVLLNTKIEGLGVISARAWRLLTVS